MSMIEPVVASKEPPAEERSPFSQLSSMDRGIEAWVVNTWLVTYVLLWRKAEITANEGLAHPGTASDPATGRPSRRVGFGSYAGRAAVPGAIQRIVKREDEPCVVGAMNAWSYQPSESS